MGKQTKCGSTKTKTGRPCQRLAMVGYSRCQKHRGDWNKPQVKRTKKR
ncbi:HGGxSTG domain-containing protein (plasmid) [Streptomyces sp. LZ34]